MMSKPQKFTPAQIKGMIFLCFQAMPEIRTEWLVETWFEDLEQAYRLEQTTGDLYILEMGKHIPYMCYYPPGDEEWGPRLICRGNTIPLPPLVIELLDSMKEEVSSA